MKKNAFKPNETSRARTILQRDSIVELDDESAKELIKQKKAEEVQAKKPAKEETSAKEEKTEKKVSPEA